MRILCLLLVTAMLGSACKPREDSTGEVKVQPGGVKNQEAEVTYTLVEIEFDEVNAKSLTISGSGAKFDTNLLNGYGLKDGLRFPAHTLRMVMRKRPFEVTAPKKTLQRNEIICSYEVEYKSVRERTKDKLVHAFSFEPHEWKLKNEVDQGATCINEANLILAKVGNNQEPKLINETRSVQYSWNNHFYTLRAFDHNFDSTKATRVNRLLHSYQFTGFEFNEQNKRVELSKRVNETLDKETNKFKDRTEYELQLSHHFVKGVANNEGLRPYIETIFDGAKAKSLTLTFYKNAKKTMDKSISCNLKDRSCR